MGIPVGHGDDAFRLGRDDLVDEGDIGVAEGRRSAQPVSLDKQGQDDEVGCANGRKDLFIGRGVGIRAQGEVLNAREGRRQFGGEGSGRRVGLELLDADVDDLGQPGR